ncbi:DUF1684 domain-containing protein [Microbacterium saperdae]
MSISAGIDPVTDLAHHHDARRVQIAGKRGPVSFVWGDFVTAQGTQITGASGLWSPLPHGRAGLEVTAVAADGVRIGGELVDGSAVLHAHAEDGPTVAEFADGAEGIIFSYDGSRFALQVWNPGSEWAERFDGISAYPYDASWVVTGEVALLESGRTIAISHHRDPAPVEVPVIAEVRFARDGREHVLLGTSGGPGRDGITLLFTDATSGPETYRAGRLLALPERRAGAVELDFNRTALLPCAFSLAWNCPIPAAENALGIAVRAGEKHAVDGEGRELL